MTKCRFREFRRGAATRVDELLSAHVLRVECEPPEWLVKKAENALGQRASAYWLRLVNFSKKTVGFAMLNSCDEVVYLVLGRHAQDLLPRTLWQLAD